MPDTAEVPKSSLPPWVCALLIVAIVIVVAHFAMVAYNAHTASSYTDHFAGENPDEFNIDRPTGALQEYVDLAPARPRGRAPPAVREEKDSRTMVNDWIVENRGKRASDLARGTTMEWLDRHHTAGVHVGPEAAATAEQELWTGAQADDGIQTFDSEQAYDSQQDAVRYHQKTPASYDDRLASTVLDSRSVENHRKWVESVKPWSGTATTVDTVDEAMEASISFVGLQRPRPVAQHNALQLTEIDYTHLMGNSDFRFTGEQSAHKRCEE